jgi:nicotinamide riboside transporter PnuC
LSELFRSAVYPTLDSYLFVMGITVSLLAAWGYIDSQYMNILSIVLGLLLWILLTVQDPANFNYVIIYVYNLYRIIQTSVSWTKKYRQTKQKAEA